MSSSSSSEDELMNEQLKEAVSTYENSLKATKKSEHAAEEKNKTNISNKKSKRYPEKEANDPDDCVTPEFQEFVAKKLRIKLDELIELVEVPRKKFKKNSIDKEYKFQIFKNIYVRNDLLDCSNGNSTHNAEIKNGKNSNENRGDIKNEKKSKHKKVHKKKKSSGDSSGSESSTDMDVLKDVAVDVNNFNLY